MFMSFNQGHPLLTLSPTVPNTFGEPRSSSPSRRSRPLVDRTDGDDDRGVPRLFELEAEGIDQYELPLECVEPAPVGR